MIMSGSLAGPWVVNDGRAGDSGSSCQLFCFPHAGGGPSFFRPWSAGLRPEIAVRRVLLPGREGRLEEQPFRHIADLVDPLCAALEPLLEQPYALFGHSMGAAVAYEVGRRLSGAGMAGPRCLIVSGRKAPGHALNRRLLHGLPDEEFVREVARLNGIPPEVLSEPELLSMLRPHIARGLRALGDVPAASRRPPGLPGRRLSEHLRPGGRIHADAGVARDDDRRFLRAGLPGRPLLPQGKPAGCAERGSGGPARPR